MWKIVQKKDAAFVRVANGLEQSRSGYVTNFGFLGGYQERILYPVARGEEMRALYPTGGIVLESELDHR
jgi:hypothetical protein